MYTNIYRGVCAQQIPMIHFSTGTMIDYHFHGGLSHVAFIICIHIYIYIYVAKHNTLSHL